MNQDKFKELLRDKGLKVTKQRILVLDTMANAPNEHLTAEEIYDLTKESFPEIGLATIYRTIQVLLDLHIINKVNFDDGFVRYELYDREESQSEHHHHHAICLMCGKVYSFKDDLLDTLEQAIYQSMGFVVVNHEVKLYGHCNDCNRKRNKTNNNMEA